MNTMNKRARDELYRELEPHFKALITSSARKFARLLDVPEEDVAQEARLAIYQALPKYEYNKSYGRIHSFARRAIRNALCSLAAKATMEHRVQRVVISDNGELKTIRCRPKYLDDFSPDYFPDETQNPDVKMETSRWVEKLQILEMKLNHRLNERQRAVFNCVVRPSNELQLMARNKDMDITNPLIAEFLGVSKNSVDWSLHIIKKHFTILAEAEFSELVEKAVEERHWPLLYSSERENDLELIRSVIARRRLDPKPIEMMSTKRRGTSMRRIETYAWGSVILLRFQDKTATLVVEGRFNEITGEVLSDLGWWKTITKIVPYYKQLVRELS